MAVASHTSGIVITAFIIAVAVSIGYYQFVYIPEASRTPVLPQEVLEPKETVEVSIVEGASNPDNGRFFVPTDVRATMGVSNRVV